MIPRSSTAWDLAIVTISRTTAGTATISACAGCAGAGFLVGVTQNQGSPATICSLTAGTTTIATISSTHVTGSFAGTGTCFNPTGTSTAFAMTSGTFDVGISSLTLTGAANR